MRPVVANLLPRMAGTARDDQVFGLRISVSPSLAASLDRFVLP